MTTTRRSAAAEEIHGVRHAALALARALLEVAIGTIATAAFVTFALANDAVAKVMKPVRDTAA